MCILAFLAEMHTSRILWAFFSACLLSFAIAQTWHLCKKGCLKWATNQGALPYSSHKKGLWSNALLFKNGGSWLKCYRMENMEADSFWWQRCPLSTLLIRSCCPCLVALLFNIFFDLWATSYIIPMISIIFKVRVSFW